MAFGGLNHAVAANYYDNNGEYFRETALYLNSQGRGVKVLFPNNIDSFSVYYKGLYAKDAFEADYAVLSLDQDRTLLPAEYCGPLQKTYGPNYEVIGVYKCL
jgi:hypothetical protein